MRCSLDETVDIFFWQFLFSFHSGLLVGVIKCQESLDLGKGSFWPNISWLLSGVQEGFQITETRKLITRRKSRSCVGCRMSFVIEHNIILLLLVNFSMGLRWRTSNKTNGVGAMIGLWRYRVKSKSSGIGPDSNNIGHWVLCCWKCY